MSYAFWPIVVGSVLGATALWTVFFWFFGVPWTPAAVIGFCLTSGLFLAWGGMSDWDWFWAHPTSRLLQFRLGMAKARLVYLVMGLAITVVSLWIGMAVRQKVNPSLGGQVPIAAPATPEPTDSQGPDAIKNILKKR
ncbi:MAG: hypothetical protein NZ700_14215 [Gemmataceae bacterium]|nr:hypothetical protein [Gemmataceae bacterium]MDW8264579.1 hypothetical protein [Gemmataceae bacterium]